MFQDVLRSAVYRSLTKTLPVRNETGNQSGGYGTNRKSKHSISADVNTPPEQEGTRIGPQSFMEEMYDNDPDHLQLFQASKGARELAQMIDSLSRAPNLDGRSKYIAKDLLRGAQDLQSSLVMLAKLQEASKSTTRPKVEGRKGYVNEEIAAQRTTRSRRFAFQEPRRSVDEVKKVSATKYKQRSEFGDEDIGFEEIKGARIFAFKESRHSVDGSYRDFVEEHKKVSLMGEEAGVGEIMFAKRFGSRKSRFSLDESSEYSVEKKISQLKFKQRSQYMEEGIGVEDAKGSKRFGVQNSRFSKEEFSRSSIGELKKVSEIKFKQRSGFVEEEIGVEEIMPSKRFGLQEPRASVDGSSRDSIEELRRVIKDSLSRQNLLPESSNDEIKCQSQQLRPHESRRPQKPEERSYERNKNLLANQAKSTSVVAKLMGLDEVPSATVQMNKSGEERKKSAIVLRPSFEIDRPMTRKAQSPETPDSTQKTLHEIIAAMQFKGLLKSGRGEEPRPKSRPFDTSQFEKYSRSFIKEDEIPPIVIMKPLFLPHWEKGGGQKILLLDKISAKEEIQSADSIQEEKDYGHAIALPKALERKEAKSIEEANVEVPQMSALVHKLQRKKAFKNRETTDEEQKLDGKKEEKEDIKKKKVPISRTNTNHTAPAKPEKQMSTAKNKVSRVKPESKNSSNSVKEKKTIVSKSGRKSTDIKDGKSSNPHEGKNSFSNSRTAHDLPEGVKKDKPCNKDAKKEDSKTLHELLQKTGQVWEIPDLAKEAIHLPDKRTTTRIASGLEEDLMCLLLGSRSFISQAQQLFQIDARQPVHYQRKGIEEDVMRNAKLYLDCGKELMVRKNDQHEFSINPMLLQNTSPSLTKLAAEISSVIEILTSYSKVDDNVTSEDNLYTRLERDLICKEMMANANWDIGWVNCACTEGADQVAGEVEEHILSLLVTELAQDLV